MRKFNKLSFLKCGVGDGPLPRLAAAIWLMAAIMPVGVRAQEQKAQAERPVLQAKQHRPVKAVYQITSDEMQNGVNKGLASLKGAYQDYIDLGFTQENLKLKAVFHGKASSHLLTDAAWNKHAGAKGGNPNTALIDELIAREISIELCEVARTRNGWAKEDIHPGVVLVGNAYHRLVELQHEGFGYVKF